MVQNGAHKCSKNSEFPVEEEKKITEEHKIPKVEENITPQVSPVCDEVPADKASKHEDSVQQDNVSKHEDLVQKVNDKTAPKKFDKVDAADASKEFTTVMKRMAELEEKMTHIHDQPITLPPEKEEMLNATISRADVLEQQLNNTKKALEDSLAKQEQLSIRIRLGFYVYLGLRTLCKASPIMLEAKDILL